jgi:hypothetical protein
LKQALLKEYEHFSDKRIRNIDRGKFFIIDGRGVGDYGADRQLFGWFCTAFAESRNQPMPSAIQKVSMGVSATPATTNQNCVSERLRIGMMSHTEDALTRRRREKWRGAVIFYTQRLGSVVFSVTNTSDCSFF